FRICELEDVLVIKVCNKVLLQISDEIESHGVGLQSCRMLIESVGGKLEVYQEADQFIFECELPILQNC
ncbi:sensor histidine kinase, partial [Turicibacter sanguinis]|nr:sensor histidine kinase [Turicibacter sanguinis]